MEGVVIDNENIMLSDEINGIMIDAHRASIAVGYFFISGFAEIMDSLKKIEASDDPDHKIRFLISPTTNRVTADALLADYRSEDNIRSVLVNESIEKTGDKIVGKQVKKTLEYMSQTQNDHRATIKLRKLIKNGKIEVKVYTKEQLHAKAYIFERKDSQLNRIAIVGSSNLSISGMKHHTELNLKTLSSNDSREVLDWFDRHWEDPTCQEFTNEIADIIDESWITERSPENVYKKALHNNGCKNQIIVEKTVPVKLYDFQKIAVSDAISKLEEYGGVMISDVVGTGKSFIGSAVLKYLIEKRNSHCLIICPPHLIDMWEDYAKKFEMRCNVLSRFKIGSDDNLLDKYSYCDTILIDESHNFRHTNTQAYAALMKFMENKTEEAMVIMLTATPISNKISDLKNQLEFFPYEKLSRIPVLDDKKLGGYFKGMDDPKGISEENALKVQELLKYILIRRTRKQIIEDYAGHEKINGVERSYLEMNGKKNYFPHKNIKHPEKYDVNKVYNGSVSKIYDSIERLRLSRFAPGDHVLGGPTEDFPTRENIINRLPNTKKYENLKNSSASLKGLIRTSLLKRMESSIEAFATSIDNYLGSYETFQSILNMGKIPIGKNFQDEIYKMVTYDDTDSSQLELQKIYDDHDDKIEELTSEYDPQAFDIASWIKDLDKDIAEFRNMRSMLKEQKTFTIRDKKLHLLRKLVDEIDKKLIIFTESAITARYIHRYLKLLIKEKDLKEKNIAQIDSKKGVREKMRLIRLFDPINNNYELKPDEKELDILISTDVLSEGVNLQAGQTVINYDFHWNPVRLIQRVGRIDRIGTPHSVIDVINFLPAEDIEKKLALQDRVEGKIKTIQRILGKDSKILTNNELEPNSIREIYKINSPIFDDELGGILNIKKTKAEMDIDSINKDMNKIKNLEKIPFGIRSIAGHDKLLIACDADEIIRDNTGRIIFEQKFKKYYEVTNSGIKSIWLSTLLKQFGDNDHDSCCNSHEFDLPYNKFIAKAWDYFNRDLNNSTAENKRLKHQEYFLKKLKESSESPTSSRYNRLQKFIGQNMLSTYPPYKSLIKLREKIDKTIGINMEMILSELDSLEQSMKHIVYKREIIRPRILYSMLVKE